VYELTSGKTRNMVKLTTLQKTDGSKTANMKETLKIMIEQFIPEDNAQDDTSSHVHEKTNRATDQNH